MTNSLSSMGQNWNDNMAKMQGLQIHKLRQANAKIRDDYARSLKREQSFTKELHKAREERQMQTIVKQKDYEWIIKQDKELERYKEAYEKMNDKYKNARIELKEAEDKLESRDALICATRMALDHVIESA